MHMFMMIFMSLKNACHRGLCTARRHLWENCYKLVNTYLNLSKTQIRINSMFQNSAFTAMFHMKWVLLMLQVDQTLENGISSLWRVWSVGGCANASWYHETVSPTSGFVRCLVVRKKVICRVTTDHDYLHRRLVVCKTSIDERNS